MLCVYILHTRPTTHDTMQNCLKWEAYWTFSLLVALANNFSTTQTHTNPYRYTQCSCAHTHKFHTKAWMVGRLLSFVFFCVFCYIFPLPLLSNEKKRTTTITNERTQSDSTPMTLQLLCCVVCYVLVHNFFFIYSFT